MELWGWLLAKEGGGSILDPLAVLVLGGIQEMILHTVADIDQDLGCIRLCPELSAGTNSLVPLDSLDGGILIVQFYGWGNRGTGRFCHVPWVP